MSKIRSKNTKAELLVFRELRKRKVYFQKHYSKVPGTPDIALPRKKKAFFIDGGFWHGYQFCKQKKNLPNEYWVKKIEENIERDKKNMKKLKDNGWEVMRLWEHEIEKNFEDSIIRIIDFLKRD